MNAHEVTCEYCGARAYLSQPGRFCSATHRAYFHRDALIAQRRRLAEQAEQALASGDVAALELVAMTAARLLA